MLRKLLDALSIKAVRQRLDRRRLQEELDFHRLYLLTSYHERFAGQEIDDDIVEALDAEARRLGLEGTRAAVATALQNQTLYLTRALHKTLQNNAFAAPYLADAASTDKIRAFQRGRSHAVPRQQRHVLGRAGASQPINAASSSPPLQQVLSPSAGSIGGERVAPKRVLLLHSEIEDALVQRIGFSLGIGPSVIAHADAGDGLFLKGKVSTGQIVAFYPGVAYSPLHHRHIPGYPLVAQCNPFLLARFDGFVLDAQPWGKGEANMVSDCGSKSTGTTWPVSMQNAAEKALAMLEGRNPLASAHFANHPPAGTQPNVAVAPLDWSPPASEPFLRAYLPCVDFVASLHNENRSSVEHEERTINDSVQEGQFFDRGNVVTVALVALRPIQDEEILLNYRLNPNAPAGLPDWYSPVNVDEDARRWS